MIIMKIIKRLPLGNEKQPAKTVGELITNLIRNTVILCLFVTAFYFIFSAFIFLTAVIPFGLPMDSFYASRIFSGLLFVLIIVLSILWKDVIQKSKWYNKKL